MTSKTLENAARALAKKDGHCPSRWRVYIPRAQAVYDSGKVLILPADAEPMVGDIV